MDIENIESIINREVTIKGYEFGLGKQCSIKVDINGEEKLIRDNTGRMKKDLEKWEHCMPYICIIKRRGLGIKIWPISDICKPNKKLISFLIENDKEMSKLKEKIRSGEMQKIYKSMFE